MKFAIFGFACEDKTFLVQALEDKYKDDEFIDISFLSEDETKSFDAYFFLDTPSDVLAIKYNKTVDEISDEKLSQMRTLFLFCDTIGEELVVLDEDVHTCVEFIDFYKHLYVQKKCNPMDVARNMLKDIPAELLEKDTVLLVDCDGTISENDVSATFLQALSIEIALLGEIFAKTRYTMYQFYKILELYRYFDTENLQKAVLKAVEASTIKKEVVQIIENQHDSLCIGLTAGALMAWQHIAEHNLKLDALFGNSYEKGYLVTPRVKEAVVKVLQEQGKKVIAIGDSIIDIPMLEKADKGYLVCYKMLGKGVERALASQEKVKIKQLNFSKCMYHNVDIEEFSL